VAARRTRLQRLIASLPDATVSPTRDPWHLILLENVVYLTDDETRERAFRTLREHTGLDAVTIERCPDELLLAACSPGRMAEQQMRKLRECAALFRTVGDPRELVRLPAREARKALRRFPGIGAPGADKLLLLAGAEAVLALDSNALRTLLRLGYGNEGTSYAQSYASAQRAAMAELPAQHDALASTFLALRAHGQSVCRNTRPACGACVFRDDCPSAKPA
jgi:endonuclease III